MINKNSFQEKLKNKEYYECINIIRKNIIDYLVTEIQKKDSNFFYTTTKDLYIFAKQFLDSKYSSIAYKIYILDIFDEPAKYTLYELMDIQSSIQK